jgi:hypothetical protein
VNSTPAASRGRHLLAQQIRPSYSSSSCTAELEPRNSSPPLLFSQTKADASNLVIVNKEHSSIFER